MKFLNKFGIYLVVGIALVLMFFVYKHAYYYNVDEFSYHGSIVLNNLNSGLMLGRPLFIFINYILFSFVSFFVELDIIGGFTFLSILQGLFSIGALAFYFLFIKVLFNNQRLAFFSSLSLATCFGFLFFGGSLLSEPLMNLFLMSSLFCIAKFFQTKKQIYFYISFVLLGIGFNVREMIIVALPLHALILYYSKSFIKIRDLLLSFILFLILASSGVVFLFFADRQGYIETISISLSNNSSLIKNFSSNLFSKTLSVSNSILIDGIGVSYIVLFFIGFGLSMIYRQYRIILTSFILSLPIVFAFLFNTPQGRLYAVGYFGVFLFVGFVFEVISKKLPRQMSIPIITLFIFVSAVLSYFTYTPVNNYLVNRQKYAKKIINLHEKEQNKNPIFLIGKQSYIFNGPINFDGKIKTITFGSAWDKISLEEQVSSAIKNGNTIFIDFNQYSKNDAEKVRHVIAGHQLNEYNSDFTIIKP